MDDELLFSMVEECVGFAVERLENSQSLTPFAMAIDTTKTIKSFNSDEVEDDRRYEQLLDILKAEVLKGEIEAIALLARVTIPSNFNPAVSEGLRVHIEERRSAHEKLSARYLYIPYQLYRSEKTGEKIMVKLHDPIPVGFPSEIF
ncbi:MAG: hypothetical protein U9Q62_07910 [Campylobacterota bacterium]|nr:hypothetical protein [Campylobacterota bacterium]